jgi:hypothetical protein
MSWQWTPDILFSYAQLVDGFRSRFSPASGKPVTFARAKGVFHTGRGWYLLELVSGHVHERAVRIQTASRCLVFFSNQIFQTAKELSHHVKDCIQSG